MNNIDIKKLIEERGETGKFDGIAPEGVCVGSRRNFGGIEKL